MPEGIKVGKPRLSPLASYILTRALLIIPTILILYTLVFIVLRVIPGNPIEAALGTRYIPEELKQQLAERLGLNKPLYVQYFEYLWNILHGDFGESLVIRGRPIWEDLKARFPATLELTIWGFTISVFLGLLTGTLAAVKRGSKIDTSMRIFSIVAYTLFIPWLGMMLQLVFGLWLGWLPTSGRLSARIELDTITGIYTLDAILTGNIPAFIDAVKHLILPSLTLGIVLSGAYTRLVRTNLSEVLASDFIRAYKARGIRDTKVLRHALKNAFIPIVTMMGLQFAILLGGAVLTETTFSWPGMGSYLLEKVTYRDYTAIQGAVIFFAFFVGLISLIVDVIYALIDPRIRY